MKLPKYINCKNKEIEICDYFMFKECKETCAYARDIRGENIGAMDKQTINRLEKSIILDSENE